MKIAQLAPLRESIPPVLSGRTEQTISYLTEALVRQGHEVTLFASGDSVTSARLVATCPQSLHLSSGISNYDAPLITLMERALQLQTRSMSSIRIWVHPLSSGTPLQHTGSLHASYSSRRTGTAACLPKIFPICHWCHSRTRNASRWLGQIGTARSTLDFLAISSPLASSPR